MCDEECLGGNSGHKLGILFTDDIEVTWVITVPLEEAGEVWQGRFATSFCVK